MRTFSSEKSKAHLIQHTVDYVDKQEFVGMVFFRIDNVN